LCEKSDYFLKDRAGAEFPVVGDPGSCRTTILNKDILKVPQYVPELWATGVTSFRLYFYEEDAKEMNRVAEFFRREQMG
ncbi:MAG: hypothetical protein WC977_06665, partial [Anaerovoracaceae bacterium]